MNINDFEEQCTIEDVPKTFQLIFDRQLELSKKYVPVEVSNGLRWYPEHQAGNLNLPTCQSQMKDFAWRIMEEIGESIEAMEESINSSSPVEHFHHAKEELADGLHFITELAIFCHIKPSEIEEMVLSGAFIHRRPLLYSEFIKSEKDTITSQNVISKTLYNRFNMLLPTFVKELGVTMNYLKNKPWKTTQILTDDKAFIQSLKDSYCTYYALMLIYMEPVDVLNYYFRKSEVNKFRIKSNY